MSMSKRSTQVSGHVALVKRKRGPQFYARYRLADGRQAMHLIGPAWTKRSRAPEGFYTRKLAEQALQKILADAREGAPADSRQSSTTFEEAATEYLRFVAEERQIDPTTVADYRGVVDGYLREEFEGRSIESITADDIDAYKVRLMKEGKLSNRTIVRHLLVLTGIFKRAKRKWGLQSNPASADLVERPRVTYTNEFDTFGGDEVERLAAAAANPQDAALYRVAAFTGLRTGELFALRWSAVDFVGGLLHVRRSYCYKLREEKVPKGKKTRSVPMMPEVIDALAALKERDHFTDDGDLIFCSEVGEHLDYPKHRKRYLAALEKAGLRRIRFHDLRHAFGSAAITKLDPYAVQSYMGHAHFSTTQRYLHHKPRREDAAKLSSAFRIAGHIANSDSSGETERNSETPAVPAGE